MSAPLLIEDLSVRHGRKQAVEALTLPPLRPGTLTALVGPNGAGKSTLLRAVAGIHPMTGRLRLGEEDLTRLGSAARARRITYMPQGLPGSVSLTVLETLVVAQMAVPGDRLTMASATEGAGRVLARLGIADLALMPLDRLSGGQRQLAALAQALVRSPRVLLLDEPTSALDLRFQLSVMELVRRMVAEDGLIGLVVLHDLALAARYADGVAVLQHGRLFGVGAPEATITVPMLEQVYGVTGRIERGSDGALLVLADRPLPR